LHSESSFFSRLHAIETTLQISTACFLNSVPNVATPTL
jgi:hypothetical protein